MSTSSVSNESFSCSTATSLNGDFNYSESRDYNLNSKLDIIAGALKSLWLLTNCSELESKLHAVQRQLTKAIVKLMNLSSKDEMLETRRREMIKRATALRTSFIESSLTLPAIQIATEKDVDYIDLIFDFLPIKRSNVNIEVSKSMDITVVTYDTLKDSLDQSLQQNSPFSLGHFDFSFQNANDERITIPNDVFVEWGRFPSESASGPPRMRYLEGVYELSVAIDVYDFLKNRDKEKSFDTELIELSSMAEASLKTKVDIDALTANPFNVLAGNDDESPFPSRITEEEAQIATAIQLSLQDGNFEVAHPTKKEKHAKKKALLDETKKAEAAEELRVSNEKAEVKMQAEIKRKEHAIQWQLTREEELKKSKADKLRREQEEAQLARDAKKESDDNRKANAALREAAIHKKAKEAIERSKIVPPPVMPVTTARIKAPTYSYFSYSCSSS